jgi:hypothetical protein
MSLISTAYAALLTRIETVLDTANQKYKRIPNPYQIDENAELELRKGYGLAVLDAENTNRQVNCKVSIARNMEVVLTRLYTGKVEDAPGRAGLEQLLLEDQHLIINDLEQDISINGSTMYTRYVSDSGIEFVQGVAGRFLMLKTQFSLEYMEDFT